MKTGNPKESAGKDRMTFSLIIKALKKKPQAVEKDRLVTNGLTAKNCVFTEILEFQISVSIEMSVNRIKKMMEVLPLYRVCNVTYYLY